MSVREKHPGRGKSRVKLKVWSGREGHRGQRVVGKEAAKQAGAKQEAADAPGARNPPSGGGRGGRCPGPSSATLSFPLDSLGTLLLGSPEPDRSRCPALNERP